MIEFAFYSLEIGAALLGEDRFRSKTIGAEASSSIALGGKDFGE